MVPELPLQPDEALSRSMIIRHRQNYTNMSITAQGLKLRICTHASIHLGYMEGSWKSCLREWLIQKRN